MAGVSKGCCGAEVVGVGDNACAVEEGGLGVLLLGLFDLGGMEGGGGSGGGKVC